MTSHSRDILLCVYMGAAIRVSMNVPLNWAEYAIINTLLYAAIPYVIIRLWSRDRREYLLGAGDLILGAKYSFALMALSVPFMWVASGMDEFQGYYPLWQSARDGVWEYIKFEAYILLMMAWTEIFYRGFLMGTLNKLTKYGNEVHAVVYMLAHIGKPGLEVPYSLFAGWVFGRVDKRCGSILPSLAMHWLCSCAFDAMVILRG